jgi:hypothetical protein
MKTLGSVNGVSGLCSAVSGAAGAIPGAGAQLANAVFQGTCSFVTSMASITEQFTNQAWKEYQQKHPGQGVEIYGPVGQGVALFWKPWNGKVPTS